MCIWYVWAADPAEVAEVTRVTFRRLAAHCFSCAPADMRTAWSSQMRVIRVLCKDIQGLCSFESCITYTGDAF
jgi:hypothetical protein